MGESRDRPSERPDVPVPGRGSVVGGEATPRPVPEAQVFVFRTVRQSGGDRRLPWGSAHLTLVFDERGVEISGSHPGERSVVPWSAVTRVSRGASERSPDGGSVTTIGIESPGRIMRFVVTSHRRDPIELAALSEQVQRWSDAAGTASAGTASAGTASGDTASAGAASAGTASAGTASGDTVSAGAGSGDTASQQQPDLAPVFPAPSVQPAGPSTAAVPTDGPRAGGPPARPAREPGPGGMPPMVPVPAGGQDDRSPAKRGRTRRGVLLLIGLAFVASGVGLAIALANSGPVRPTAGPTTARPTPDQALAGRLLLTRRDLPTGWRVSPDSAGAGSSPRVQTGESAITKTFARCMGISPSQASLALGGGAADQTAGTTSPVFLAPMTADRPGFALELQTGATIVRTHRDEQSDFSLLADPRYPQCAGSAVASETQLGADSSSGTDQAPGPASVTEVELPAPAGEQVAGLLVSFTISDRSASVPVEVETVAVGEDRIEANLQVLAIGGAIPAGVVNSSLSVFEQRVATGGRSAQV